MSATRTIPAATLTLRLATHLALHVVCCARCKGVVLFEHAERTARGHWRCRDFADCRYRRDQHRRIADELRAGSDDAGRCGGGVRGE